MGNCYDLDASTGAFFYNTGGFYGSYGKQRALPFRVRKNIAY